MSRIRRTPARAPAIVPWHIREAKPPGFQIDIRGPFGTLPLPCRELRAINVEPVLENVEQAL